MRQINYQKRLTGFLAGRKCVFCGSRRLLLKEKDYIAKELKLGQEETKTTDNKLPNNLLATNTT